MMQTEPILPMLYVLLLLHFARVPKTYALQPRVPNGMGRMR
jgi:hypothetical protein